MRIDSPKIDPAALKAQAERDFCQYMRFAMRAQRRGDYGAFDYYRQHADHCLRLANNPTGYLSVVQPKPSSTVKKIVNDPDFATPPTWAANQRLPITRPVPLTLQGARYRILQEFQQRLEKEAEKETYLGSWMFDR